MGDAQPISNQFFKGLPGFANPGQSSASMSPINATTSAPAGSLPNPYMNPWQGANALPGGASSPSAASHDIGHGIVETGLQYPGLSSDFANYLLSQIGQGMKPFNEQTALPTGGMTAPGQLTAGLNPMLSQLMQFFMSGGKQFGNFPGMGTLENIAQNGINVLPAWQAMVGAQQQNIAQNQAQLREQFGSMGDLAGSPFGTAESNYMSQTTADQNALLSQLTLQGILQGQMPAAQDLSQIGMDLSGTLQAINQQAIQNRYQEFQRTQPQNNPMMQYLAMMGTLYPPTTKTPTAFQTATQFLGALSGSGYSGSNAAGGSTAITF